MEDQVNRLVDKVWGQLQELPDDKRLLIAIAGIPGSGKTTLSLKVVNGINARFAAASSSIANPSPPPPPPPPPAVFVPMDGYHLTRAQLSAMPDPALAHARRGAEFTFDGAAFLRLVSSLRAPPPWATVYAPSFDHAVKDPKPDDIAVPASARVVFFEGLYVCLDRAPWRDAAAVMDDRWFVEVGRDEARRRLVKRHVEAGIARDEEEAGRRADESDLLNADEILAGKWGVDEVIESREDGSWR